MRYAESGLCRREILLDAMSGGSDAGTEKPACSGCDICDGTAKSEPADLRLVYDFILKNNRCFSPEEAAQYLAERGNRISREKNGFSQWQISDFTEMLDELEKTKCIRTIPYFPWKNKLAVCIKLKKKDLLSDGQAGIHNIRT
ncbi:hypothetical protein K7I13_04210 [Brucepastera parasyntrophica]|uniref:hypothetical protein n=1 Tax=Brucepastera parasyntrophica TaxID=2880008 RepID=UPI00210A60D6|nr:hypothetical protein [Brucepastera parasyntrophica]ULQ60512.1 hypothetical protein K7I13_04210 [Brucepastera parasyntrophica]